jgi:hypothetical protein
MTDDVIATFRALNVAADVVVPVEQLVRTETDIRAQQYQSAKEAAEIAAARERTARALQEQLEAFEAHVLKERDTELAALDRQIRAEHDVPSRGVTESPSEFSEKLTRRLIVEKRPAPARRRLRPWTSSSFANRTIRRKWPTCSMRPWRQVTRR